MLIGIKAGESRSGSTGATRRTVSLAIDEAGQVVTIDDRKITIAGDTLVFFHKSDAGTFHGVRCVESLKTAKAGQAEALKVGQDIKGVLSESSSGGGEIAALVVKVNRPIAVVTSGYLGRRGWVLHLFAPDGNGGILYQKLPPKEYRAAFAQVETL